MSFRIFNSVDMVVLIDTDTWEATVRPIGDIWYRYNKLEAPILYSLYQKIAESPLVLDQPFTEFEDEKGNGFEDDVALQVYLNEVLGDKENKELDTIKIGGSEVLLVTDRESHKLLCELLEEVKTTNKMFNILFHDQI